MAFTALGAVGRRVRPPEPKDAVVIKLSAFPTDGRVTFGAVIRVSQWAVGPWLTVTVRGVAAHAFGGRDVAALDVTGVALRYGVGVYEGEELGVVEDRALPPRRFVTPDAVEGKSVVPIDLGVGAQLVGSVAPHALPGRDRPVL